METTIVVLSQNHADCAECAWHRENAEIMQRATGTVSFKSQSENGVHFAWAQQVKR
jgi:hypothetical protein